MPRRMRVRLAAKVLAVAGLAAGLVVVVMTEPALAVPCQANTVDYYSDAGCTNYVGTRWVNCSAPYVTQQGQVPTRYRITVFQDCCGGCHNGAGMPEDGCVADGTTYSTCN